MCKLRTDQIKPHNWNLSYQNITLGNICFYQLKSQGIMCQFSKFLLGHYSSRRHAMSLFSVSPSLGLLASRMKNFSSNVLSLNTNLTSHQKIIASDKTQYFFHHALRISTLLSHVGPETIRSNIFVSTNDKICI